LCYWKQWKLIRTRIDNLEKLGINRSQAYQWGNTRNGYWRVVQSPILRRALSNAFLKEKGLLSLKEVVATKTVYV
jgi:hypothetical protein